eukprot:TRINITY_DN38113_c0_g2_i1.p3 TRINITY_DN38113_c0_g2~~TRINITY_DN38113_c0_g2_i1.p3  ORF type:complete len:115 (+),score=7.97 TRINITY_DN38113_c0_g2_i1:375-719(+)
MNLNKNSTTIQDVKDNGAFSFSQPIPFSSQAIGEKSLLSQRIKDKKAQTIGEHPTSQTSQSIKDTSIQAFQNEKRVFIERLSTSTEYSKVFYISSTKRKNIERRKMDRSNRKKN